MAHNAEFPVQSQKLPLNPRRRKWRKKETPALKPKPHHYIPNPQIPNFPFLFKPHTQFYNSIFGSFLRSKIVFFFFCQHRKPQIFNPQIPAQHQPPGRLPGGSSCPLAGGQRTSAGPGTILWPAHTAARWPPSSWTSPSWQGQKIKKKKAEIQVRKAGVGWEWSIAGTEFWGITRRVGLQLLAPQKSHPVLPQVWFDLLGSSPSCICSLSKRGLAHLKEHLKSLDADLSWDLSLQMGSAASDVPAP